MVDKKSISEFDLAVANGTETLVANQSGVTQRFEAAGFAKVFGLGSIDTPTLADLDAQDIPAGFYQWASGASGTLPRPGEAGYGIVIRRSSGSSEQAAMIAFDDNGQNIYYRQAYGGSWQAWQRLIDSGDTLAEADWEAGSSATKALPSPSDVKAAISALSPLSEEYQSTAQSMVTGGLLTLNHGLSSQPKLIRMYAVCITAEDGFSVGDKFDISAQQSRGTGNAVARSFALTFDSTSISIRNGDDEFFASTVHKTSGVVATLSRSRWDLYVEAWA